MLIQQFLNRCDLLGIEWLPLCWLCLNMLCVLFITSFVLQVIKFQFRHASETFLAAGLIELSCIVCTVTTFGAIGLLSWKNSLISHLLVCAVLPLWPRDKGYGHNGRALLRQCTRLLRILSQPILSLVQVKTWKKDHIPEYLLTACILIILGFFLVLAIGTLPMNYDSNTYRLSRVAYWLQEQNISHFQTNDQRQNFMAQNADLVMLWLISFFRYGFPLVHVTQFFGGLLGCAAVYEFCRGFGFSRLWRLGAVITFLGIPNAATQFFTSQTDLFTTGCLVAGLYFLFQALHQHQCQFWSLFGVGLGLAIGAKGTVFYWGPGLLWLFICWGWIARTPWKNMFNRSRPWKPPASRLTAV